MAKIRDEAVAFYEAQHQQDIEDAAQHLLDTVLYHPQNGSVVNRSALTVVHEDHEASMYVFTDGDIFLAVYGNSNEVVLVEDRDGWTRLSGPLTSLAELGEALSEQEVSA